MSSRIPSYLYKNRYNIYYFQWRFPKHLIHNNKLFFRKSLRTKNKSDALKQVRMWMVIMDKTAKYLFDHPSKFHEAMSILQQLKNILHCDWMVIDEFLSELGDYEYSLLDKAQIYDAFNRYDEVKLENQHLKRTVDSLNKGVAHVTSAAINSDETESISLHDLIEKWIKSKEQRTKNKKMLHQLQNKLIQLPCSYVFYLKPIMAKHQKLMK